MVQSFAASRWPRRHVGEEITQAPPRSQVIAVVRIHLPCVAIVIVVGLAQRYGIGLC